MSFLEDHPAASRVVLYGVAGVLFVAVAFMLRPFGATANPDDYDDTYLTHVGRARVPVTAHHFDFVRAADGGHPDFGKPTSMGHGRYMRIIGDEFDADLLPMFRSTGYKELSPWTSATGYRIIDTRTYMSPEPGDVSGSFESTPGDAVTSQASFASFFEHTPGVNQRSKHLAEFRRQEDGTYLMSGSFDDMTGSNDTDYTVVLDFGFIHESSQNAFFEIKTDGEAWVFIDGQLVMDGGWGTENYQFLGGIALDGPLDMGQDAKISAVPGAIGAVSTNSTTPGDVEITQASFIDRDVYVGADGDPSEVISDPGNIGGAQDSLEYPVPMPDLNPPDDMGPASGRFDPPDGYVISSDMHVQRFRLSNSVSVTVQGDVRILVDKEVNLFINSNLNILPGSSLELWVGGPIDISQSATINAVTKNPDQCVIYAFGDDDIRYGQDTQIYAHTVAPRCQLHAAQETQIFGALIATELDMGQQAQITIMDPSAGIGFGQDVWWPPTPLTHRIDLNRIAGLENRAPYRVQVYYANRNTYPTNFSLHTNVRTLNLLQFPNRDNKD